MSKKGITLLNIISYIRRIDVVKYLVKHCHPEVVTKKKKDGMTSLNSTSINGHIEVVKYLVDHCKKKQF